MQPTREIADDSNSAGERPLPDRARLHESVAPLLRGIGSAIILLAAIIGASEAKSDLKAKNPNSSAVVQGNGGANSSDKDGTVEALTREVAELREAVQDENVVDEVLRNPWIEALGTIGSGIIVASFFADWMSKRPLPQARRFERKAETEPDQNVSSVQPPC